jgi:GNAT superfamily N-acetyltransferase
MMRWKRSGGASENAPTGASGVAAKCSDGAGWMLRRLQLADVDAAAVVRRTTFDHTFPRLAGLHTPSEDRRFFRERLFSACEIWGSFDGFEMTGIIAYREDWIDQLYVLPKAQGRGCGTALLLLAQNASRRLHLWTFQGNSRARRFYEARGFRLIEETDGAKNEEKEPDALYLWTRPSFELLP